LASPAPAPSIIGWSAKPQPCLGLYMKRFTWPHRAGPGQYWWIFPRTFSSPPMNTPR